MSSKRFKSKSYAQGNDFSYLFIHTDLAPYELVWKISQETSLIFKCEETPFLSSINGIEFKHMIYFFEGDEWNPRAWLILNHGESGNLMNVKPLPDFILVWEKTDEVCYENFWIPLLKNPGMSQMTYLYPDEKTHKIIWCFDLPHLIPKDNHV